MPSIGLPSTGICAETGRTYGPAHGVDAFNAANIRKIERGRRSHEVSQRTEIRIGVWTCVLITA